MGIAIFIPRAKAQGWPAEYGGVMLQGFYWDSYTDTQWSYLTGQAEGIAPYFSLIWVPQSGFCGNGNNMGYTPQYYFRHDSSFGSEAQLRTMIQTYKNLGTGIIADVVINHRNNLGVGGSWVDFAQETYNGTDYTMLSTDICANDDGGKTKNWATGKGISVSPNNDTGEDWDGCRDIDHKSANVNRIVKAYLSYLLNDLGYTGFRYDMVKGYSASNTGEYNAYAKPQFSVGEYWDGNASAVHNWVNGTKVDGTIQSGAFDFAFRYTCRDAANNGQWGKLVGITSAADQTYNRYAVTFVENHDTEYRSASAQQDPIKKDTLAVNAWLLANPGTPCVFYKHWQKYRKEIKMMIEARRLVGITNTSAYENLQSGSTFTARKVKGTKGSLIVVCGNGASSYGMPEGYTELMSGKNFRYLVSSDCDKASWAATVARIVEEEKGEVFTPHTATVYVKANFTPVYFYVWEPTKNNNQPNGSWPGKQQTTQVTVDGEQWYAQTFDINEPDYYFNIIFNQGSGKPQTTDIGHINSDRFFTATLNGSKIDYTDVTSVHQSTAIHSVTTTLGTDNHRIFSLSGVCLGTDISRVPAGIYIIGGKKVMISK